MRKPWAYWVVSSESQTDRKACYNSPFSFGRNRALCGRDRCSRTKHHHAPKNRLPVSGPGLRHRHAARCRRAHSTPPGSKTPPYRRCQVLQPIFAITCRRGRGCRRAHAGRGSTPHRATHQRRDTPAEHLFMLRRYDDENPQLHHSST